MAVLWPKLRVEAIIPLGSQRRRDTASSRQPQASQDFQGLEARLGFARIALHLFLEPQVGGEHSNSTISHSAAGSQTTKDSIMKLTTRRTIRCVPRGWALFLTT